jgi:hypothetical protein
MSHYSRVAVKMTRKSCLVKALQQMGFEKHQIEVADAAMALRGYAGDERKQKAQVRIKGAGWRGENHVGGSSNDLGFEQLEDGSFVAHISEYDRSRYNDKWIDSLTKFYTAETIREVADEYGFFIEEETTTEEGEILITVSQGF